MSLEVGSKLGHYEIVSLIGKGGMGEVYRALDPKLDRHVAIKVVGEELRNEPDRLARLEREARALAALSHPNVATIHGFEQEGETHFLVMELVEGNDLQEQIARGPLQADEALSLFVQIAEGLDAAHQQGIVHRDLKPANLKVTPDGTVKVLDFGLAKASETHQQGDPHVSQSPTRTALATREGDLVGTAPYMSPEQARGQPVDKRTDIFAFGAVMFEVLTARRAFEAGDPALTLAAVLRDEPDWSLLPPEARAELQRLIGRCLRKDPNDRIRDMGDVLYELRRLESDDSFGNRQATADSRHDAGLRKALGIGIIGGALLAGLLAGWLAGLFSQDTLPSTEPLRAELLTPPLGDAYQSQYRQQLAVAPDGSRVVFRVDDEDMLFQRQLNDSDPSPIPGTEGGSAPFISPDSEWLGYFNATHMMRLPIDGGVPQVITEANNTFGAAWVTEDLIIYSKNPASGLFRVVPGGGTPEALSTPTQPEAGHHLPSSLLPDDRHLLFSVWYNGRSDLAVLDLETGAHQTLLEHVAYGVLTPTGHLVFSRHDGLYAVRFDAALRQTVGAQVPLIRDVRTAERSHLAHFGLANNGTLVYLPGQAPRRELVLVDRAGSKEPLVFAPKHYAWPRFSPDGKQISLTVYGARTEAWLADLEANSLSRLEHDGNVNALTAWSPDGDTVLVSLDRAGAGQWELVAVNADGSGEESLSSKWGFMPTRRSGSKLIGSQFYEDANASTELFDLVTLEQTVVIPAGEDGLEDLNHNLAPSPDGRWLAYVSGPTRRAEVYLTQVDGTGGQKTVSGELGGSRVVWVGSEIFFVSEETMMVVQVDLDNGAALSQPSPMFSVSPYWEGDYYTFPNWDVSPDGSTFVFTRFVEDELSARPTHLEVATDLFSELRERLP